MPAQHYEADELDRATLDYLHRVVHSGGRGMPGLYFDADDAQLSGPAMPLWGLIAGPVIILLTLLVTWGSMRNPVPVALLMTAGLLLGGWLIVAWVRCMIARRRDAYVGYFKYIDPRYLWSGTGRGVEVEPIDMLTSAEAIGSRVRIEKADGQLFFELRTTGLADEVEEYLTRLRAQTAAEPVERGYAALAQLRDEEDDEDEEQIDAIPSPRRERASRGWLALPLLAGVAVLLFFGCKTLATTLRDDALFALVQDKDPAHLRIYLIDPRNSRHRDEVIGRLEKFHDQVARNLEQPKGDPQLRTGLAGIVRGLKKEARPFITVRFVTAEKGPGVPEGYLSAGVLSALNQKILLAMRQAIQPLTRVPGTVIPFEPVPPPIDLTDVAQVFEGPAMISIEAKVKPADRQSRECRIIWTLTMQADPDAQKHVATFETRLLQNGDDPAPAVRALYGNMGQEFRTRLGS